MNPSSEQLYIHLQAVKLAGRIAINYWGRQQLAQTLGEPSSGHVATFSSYMISSRLADKGRANQNSNVDNLPLVQAFEMSKVG